MMKAGDPTAAWLAQFDAALSSGNVDAVADLFAETSYWRDLLAFTWNVKTVEGRDGVADMLRATLAGTGPSGWTLEEVIEETGSGSEAWISFETKLGRGRGHLRLRDGKCWTLLTALEELKGFEEKKGSNRINGVEHRADRDRRTWLENRKAEEAELGVTRQPYCLIIGGGQGGIALAARLGRLGVPTLIVEKNEKPGDSWRNRYRSLVLHDPVWYDHLPYLPFPDDWPVFTPKDKMGDWLEAYAKIMELNYWGSTECTNARYDETAKQWTVTVLRGGAEMVLKPKILVFATGAYGYPRTIDFTGAESFRGEMFHTSAYRTGAAYTGRKCVVIGAGSSAHDIAVDLWEHGADVTMIQRSPSIVVRSETLMEYGFKGAYSEEALARGITTDKADLLSASIPYRLTPDFQRPLNEKIARVDSEFYEGLTRAGFLWDFGPDGSGLLAKAFRTASGYYIDVGASSLIIDGEIGVVSGKQIDSIGEREIRFADGSAIEADVIVQATGYGSMEGMVSHLISPEVAEKIGPFWGYGSGVPGDPGPWEGEIRNMWKPTKQEALWFHGGNLHLSRHYSIVVSLQIKARMEDLPTPIYW